MICMEINKPRVASAVLEELVDLTLCKHQIHQVHLSNLAM
jgi:hypothetical protein